MEYKQLGKTTLKISKLGFGAWGIGGDSYGAVDFKQAQKALEVALDNGINFYDTSNLYGTGRSEEILGDVFSKKRDKVIIASKFGLLPHSGRALPVDLSVTSLKKYIEESLKRLKSDYIDLYQFHSPRVEDLENNDLFETLFQFKKSGKIRSIGASMRSPAEAIIAIEKYNIEVVQVNFNMIDHRAIDSGLTKIVNEKNIGLIARTPLGFGFLTGKINDSNLNFDSNDHRRHYPVEQLKKWANAPKLFSELYQERTPTEIALRFCMDTPGVTTVIPGMIHEKEVTDNVRIANSKKMSSEEYEKISQIYHENDFFDSKLSYRPSK